MYDIGNTRAILTAIALATLGLAGCSDSQSVPGSAEAASPSAADVIPETNPPAITGTTEQIRPQSAQSEPQATPNAPQGTQGAVHSTPSAPQSEQSELHVAPSLPQSTQSDSRPEELPLPEHPMTVHETSPDLVIEQIANAPMGKPLTRSELADLPGYELPDDPERDSIVRGRRVAPLVDGNLAAPATSSLQSLLEEILAGLGAQDGAHLDLFDITYGEWLEFCWPEFPESRPAPQVRPEEAFFFMERTSSAGIGRGLSDHGGMDLVLIGVEFEPGVSRYANFNLYHDLRILAAPRDGNGPPVEITFVRSVIERNGMWKVFAYWDR